MAGSTTGPGTTWLRAASALAVKYDTGFESRTDLTILTGSSSAVVLPRAFTRPWIL